MTSFPCDKARAVVASLLLVGLSALLGSAPVVAQTDDAALASPMPTTTAAPESTVPGAAAPAADQPPAVRRLRDSGLPGLNARINIDSIDSWDVVQLIEFLAQQGGLPNVVVSKGVTGMTTKLKFSDVTVGDALDVVLSVNGLAYEIRDGILKIMTDAEYTILHGASFNDTRQVRIVPLRYADPVRVNTLLTPVRSAIGTSVPDPVTGTLILIDTPEKIAEMMRVVSTADMATVARIVPTETRAYTLQHAAVEDLQKEVAGLLTKEHGVVRADTRTKTMIVTDLPHNFPNIEVLINTFDRPSREVFVEAKIIQVTLNDEFRLGIDWNHLMQGVGPRFSLGTSITPPMTDVRGSATAAGSGYGSLSYKTILAGGDLSVVLDAIKAVGETKILSNPHVSVVDGNEAVIKVVRNEPYAESQLESGTTNVIGESFKFIEVGVSLSVRPRINEQGVINMAIKPEVSSVEGSYQARYSVPIVQKSYAETVVGVKDSETVIIAGMIENMKDDRDRKVPLLGQIPLLGNLFRSRVKVTQSKETIVFLTPRIVGNEPIALMRDVRKPPKGLRPLSADPGKELKPLR